GQADFAFRFPEHHAEALTRSPNLSRPVRDRGPAKPLLEQFHSFQTYCLWVDAQVLKIIEVWACSQRLSPFWTNLVNVQMQVAHLRQSRPTGQGRCPLVANEVRHQVEHREARPAGGLG